MSAAHRQHSCACCGLVIHEEDMVSVEPLVDGVIRYVAVLWDHHTYPVKLGGTNGRLLSE